MNFPLLHPSFEINLNVLQLFCHLHYIIYGVVLMDILCIYANETVFIVSSQPFDPARAGKHR